MMSISKYRGISGKNDEAKIPACNAYPIILCLPVYRGQGHIAAGFV